jgi:HlyD family secretion protein
MKKIIIISTVVVIGIVIIFTLFKGDDKSIYETIIAERGSIIQEISATGRVEAISYVDLAFEKSGRVEQINVEVGDKVNAGAVLLKIESGDILAELSQARASVESAEAKLQQYEAVLESQQVKLVELQVGTRAEEILLYESKVQNADTALVSAKESMVDVLQNAYTRSEDAVRSKADQLFNNPRLSSANLKFVIANTSLTNEVNSLRVSLENIFSLWKIDLDALSNTSELELSILSTKNNLEQVKSFLENTSLALSNAQISTTITQTIVDAWKVSISSARTNVGTAITNHATAKEKLKSAETALLITQNELALKEAGSTPEQIDAQKAAIQQAEANIVSQLAEIKFKESAVQAVWVKLAKNSLRSPIDGIITKQDAKKGAIVGANEIVASVMSEGKFEIEALVVEADIANLETGDKATLLLDAYGEDALFEAVVIKIDPAAELFEGVANYRITLAFIKDDERIRAGMTADLDIITAERKNVISIPQRAVIFKDNKKTVRLLEKDVLREVGVETGITGGRGLIEIVSGVGEGDMVVIAIKK